MRWYLKHRGVQLHINPRTIPEFEEVVVDVETDEADNVHCVGVCGDARNVYVVFLYDKANSWIMDWLKKRKIVAHNWKTDIGWLELYGISKSQVSYDTMLGEYVLNSTLLKYGLKDLCKKMFGFNWPSYKDLTKTKPYIEIACQKNESLYLTKVKQYKTKPDKIEYKLPKKIILPDLPDEVVANYNGWDCYATFTLMNNQRSRMSPTHKQFLEKIEMPTSRIMFEAEKIGIKVDVKKLLEVHKHYRILMRCYLKAWKHYVGDVLITSPAQVKEAICKHIHPIASTGVEVLQEIKHPIIKSLLKYRKASKICTTYTRPLYKRAIATLDHRVHCDFKQHTDTGRLACANPNLQNQPPAVRGCFISEEGKVFINADWSQIELRIPAHFSGEPLMVDTFVNGKQKIHQVTADQIGRSYKIGKTVNFLLTNSGGAYRLAEVAGISDDEAFDVFKKFHEKFNVYYAWTKKEKLLAYENKGIRTLFGRWVPLPQIRVPDEKIRARFERKALSVKVQGSAADLMKVAMIKIYNKHHLIPVISLHDELMYEVKKEDAKKIFNIVKEEMENVTKLKVPLVADVGEGVTWAEAKAK